MLQVKNLKFSYKKNLILDNINFSINKGEIVSILGLNGAGKSSLLKVIARIENLSGGVVLINSKNIEHFSNRELSRHLSYLPQTQSGEMVTVFDAILLGRKVHINFSPSAKDIEVVNKILEAFNIKHLALRNTNELSGGELQKVLIARAVVQEPEILLLDEPINHLDLYNQIEVMKIIKDIVKGLNIIAIIVMHDINIALRFCDKFIFLKNKKIFKLGGVEIITLELIKEIFNVSATITDISNTKIVIPEEIF